MSPALRKRLKMNLIIFTALYFILLALLVANLDSIIFVHWAARNEERTPASMRLAYDEIFVDVTGGVRLCCWYIPFSGGSSETTIVYCHGNAENISRALPHAAELARAAKANLFLFDYRGYCRSTGKPSYKTFYDDADKVFETLRGRQGQKDARFVIYGRSLGGAAAIHLASKNRVHRLITESTFASVPLHAWYNKVHFVFYPFAPDVLPSLKKAEEVKAPWLIIHGGKDRVIDVRNSGHLYSVETGSPRKRYIVEEAGHNDVCAIRTAEYFGLISEFIEK